mmetsp:Transcript_25717/g.57820  ORF Transcript_25717/g.57820 Transcript_25717/m.57820 type:complete len:254 (-) Transcript_25717:2291-3052(-)
MYDPLQQATTLRTLIVLDGGIHVYMSDTNELLFLASGTKKRRQDVVFLQKLLDEDLKVVVQPTTSKRRERTPVQLKLLGCSPQRELVLSVPSSAVQGDKAGVVPPHLADISVQEDVGNCPSACCCLVPKISREGKTRSKQFPSLLYEFVRSHLVMSISCGVCRRIFQSLHPHLPDEGICASHLLTDSRLHVFVDQPLAIVLLVDGLATNQVQYYKRFSDFVGASDCILSEICVELFRRAGYHPVLSVDLQPVR